MERYYKYTDEAREAMDQMEKVYDALNQAYTAIEKVDVFNNKKFTGKTAGTVKDMFNLTKAFHKEIVDNLKDAHKCFTQIAKNYEEYLNNNKEIDEWRAI